MKKILCLLLAILALLPVVSCNGSEPSEQQTQPPQTEQEPTAPVTQSPPKPEVPPVKPTAEIDLQTVYLYVGDTYELPYTLGKGVAEDAVLPWSSSRDCVTVKDGTVTAVKEGYAIVSAGGSTTCHVRVLPETLPNLMITTNGVEIDSKETYTDCFVSVMSESGDFDKLMMAGGIRLRGNSTCRSPKKPFRIKFNSKQNLLGLNGGAKCKSWVLLAEYLDDSFIRNATAHSLASILLEEYSTDWCYVNLYVNNEHLGVYVLCEQSQINEHRVDIEEAGADSTELQSGYLFELEGGNPPDTRPYIIYDHFEILHFYSGNPHSYVTTNTGKYGKLYFEFKNDDLSPEQVAYATKYFQSIFDVLCYATFKGEYYAIDRETAELIPSDATTAEEAISAVIDVESVARMYILGELMCNNDEHYKSFYFWFDLSEGGTGKLTFGCPWDYDGATVVWATENWQPTNKYFSAKRQVLYAAITYNEFFRVRVRELWEEFYALTNGFEDVLSVMDRTSDYYEQDFEADAKLWKPNHPQKEWKDMTIQWLRDRIAWLNEQFTAFPGLPGEDDTTTENGEEKQ